jgi:hypothetical protein
MLKYSLCKQYDIKDQPFKVGDLVVLDGFYHQSTRKWENNVIRKVTDIRRSRATNSGWKVWVDMGFKCDHCQLTPARNALVLSSGWLINAVTSYQPNSPN